MFIIRLLYSRRINYQKYAFFSERYIGLTPYGRSAIRIGGIDAGNMMRNLLNREFLSENRAIADVRGALRETWIIGRVCESWDYVSEIGAYYLYLAHGEKASSTETSHWTARLFSRIDRTAKQPSMINLLIGFAPAGCRAPRCAAWAFTLDFASIRQTNSRESRVGWISMNM